ncbi:ATP-binding region, ATPase-like domain protein, partial [Candidatus Magnetoovum chiemensis]
HYDGNIQIDAERFKRVIFNISGNAKEIMSLKGGKLLILSRLKEKGVEIVLSDTGSGVPEDIIDTLFEPFVTKGKKTGTGIGLAVTKKIVLEHSGEIFAVNGNYSEVEGFDGANFVITLPKPS